MATTSLWPYKNTPLKCITYIMNPDKTKNEWVDFHRRSDGSSEYDEDARDEKVLLVSAVNAVDISSPEKAARDFTAAKNMWDKHDGRQCYHGYQSFAAGEVTPEEAHRIGIELAERLWGDRFQVIVATHVNTNHVHNHFVINSVSITDGYKFYNFKADYEAMRRVSDEICLAHGLTIIDEQDKNTNKSWRKTGANRPAVREQICRDIDCCIRDSDSLTEFYKNLELMGYSLKVSGKYKYPALSPPDEYDKNGYRKYYRFKGLCKRDGYSIEDIARRIEDREYDEKVFAREIELYVRSKQEEHNKVNRGHKYYVRVQPLHRFNVFGKIYRLRMATFHSVFFYKYNKYQRILRAEQDYQKRRLRPKLSIETRRDIKRLDMFSAATNYIVHKRITCRNDVVERKMKLTEELDHLTSERKKTKSEDPKAATLSKQIKEIRKELKVCDFILDSDQGVTEVCKDWKIKEWRQEKGSQKQDTQLRLKMSRS
ncbi:Relaxase/Mobilisation nuclease domain-containing protein [Ruminococcaceae bacterium YRB3002]|nr:Relaxase/Mobilisation nuclease domain-containing protein [Ruminococcaceae bacterium YRB3002]